MQARNNCILLMIALAPVFVRPATVHAVGETLLVPFAACGGMLTAHPHTGSTRVRLHGLGTITPGSAVADPFYWVFPDDPSVSLGPNGGQFRFARLSEGGCTCTTECEGNNRAVADAIVGSVPPFSPSHEYEVTLDFGSAAAEPIAFGVGDCGCSDNSGALTVAFTCASDADCNDGNGCTVDVCTEAKECRHQHDAIHCGLDLSEVRALALHPDGSFVLGGSTGSAGMTAGGVVRFGKDGEPDSSFGVGGEVTTATGKNDAVNALTVQPDGTLVAVGEVRGSSTRFEYYSLFSVIRYDVAGTFDRSFADNPRLLASIASPTSARAVLVQAEDRRILALGSGAIGLFTGFLVRYDTDGTPDPNFGETGTVFIGGPPTYLQSLARQPDGNIIVQGADIGGPVTLTRYDRSGSPDTSFGSGGSVVLSLDWLEYVTPQPGFGATPDGKLVIGTSTGGQGPYSDKDADLVVVRYDVDGTPDLGFGDNGFSRVGLGRVNGAITAVAIQGDGKIVAAGSIGPFFGDPMQPGLPALVLARYGPTGALDTTFGSGGITRTKIPLPTLPVGVGIQPDGRIVVVGPNLIARYDTDGTLDPSFTVTGPICGDGIVASPMEQCDEGVNNGRVSCCTTDCHLRRMGEVCRPARSTLCDRDESCSGVSARCPSDGVADSTTPCAIQDPCTVKDHCEGGECVAGIRVCGATASQCLTPGCEKRHAKRLPRRIDVQCKVDRQNLLGAEKGGSCDAVAFAPQATVSRTTIHCTESCPTGGSVDGVPSYECHTLTAGVPGCVDSQIGGLVITKMERKKLKRDGTALARLRMSPLFRQALRKCKCLPVNVCTTIALKNGTTKPLACELTVQNRAP